MGRYRSTSDLPLPADWDRKAFGAYRYTILPFTFALIVGPFLLGPAVAIGRGGESAWGGFFGLVLLGPAVFAAIVVGWSQLPRKAPVAADIRDTDSGPGLLLPLERPASTGSVVSVVIGVALLGAGLLFFLVSSDDDRSTGAALFFLISLPALFAILLGLATYRPRKNLGDVGILLTAEQVSIDYGKGPIRTAWRDISAVGARCRRENSVLTSRTNVISLVTGDAEAGYGIIDIRHTKLETDPTRVYHLFVFYVRNPGLRSELGTEAGSARFRSGGYTSEHPSAFID